MIVKGYLERLAGAGARCQQHVTAAGPVGRCRRAQAAASGATGRRTRGVGAILQGGSVSETVSNDLLILGTSLTPFPVGVGRLTAAGFIPLGYGFRDLYLNIELKDPGTVW